MYSKDILHDLLSLIYFFSKSNYMVNIILSNNKDDARKDLKEGILVRVLVTSLFIHSPCSLFLQDLLVTYTEHTDNYCGKNDNKADLREISVI